MVVLYQAKFVQFELTMTIRKAVPADHRIMAELAAKAFIDDDVFGRFMYPKRREHPQDYISMWERKIWVQSNDYTKQYIVSVDETSGEIAAWSEWTRIGAGAERMQNPLSLRKSDFPITTTTLSRKLTWTRPQKVVHRLVEPSIFIRLVRPICRPRSHQSISRRGTINGAPLDGWARRKLAH